MPGPTRSTGRCRGIEFPPFPLLLPAVFVTLDLFSYIRRTFSRRFTLRGEYYAPIPDPDGIPVSPSPPVVRTGGGGRAAPSPAAACTGKNRRCGRLYPEYTLPRPRSDRPVPPRPQRGR